MLEQMNIIEEQKNRLKNDIYEVQILNKDIKIGDLPNYLSSIRLESTEYQAKINNPDIRTIKAIMKYKRPSDYIVAVREYAGLSSDASQGDIAKASVEYEHALKTSITSTDIYEYYRGNVIASIEKSLDYCLW